MTLNEEIALVARYTGWTLEYIRELPIGHLRALVAEFVYQLDQETYAAAYNSAMVVACLASDKHHRVRPEDIIGQRPERRVTMQDRLGQPAQIEKITLDGKEYALAPMTAAIYAELEQRFGKTTDELFDGHIRFHVYIPMIFARLRRANPQLTLTEEQVGEFLTTDSIIGKGLLPKEPTDGELTGNNS